MRIRWLLKSPDATNETIEQKQQRPNKYKDLLIISAPVKDDTDEESSSVLCLITLPEDEQSLEPTMSQQLEQLTIRIDRNGKIIKLDTSLLRNQFATFITKEIGRSFFDLCHHQDKNRLQMHLKEVTHNPSTLHASHYRLLIGPDTYTHVRVNSRLFPSAVDNEPDFIMAVHTIVSETEMSLEQTAGSSSTMHSIVGGGLSGSLLSSIQQPLASHQLQHKSSSIHHHSSNNNNNNSSMGGPLMTSAGGGLAQVISPRNGQQSGSGGSLSDHSNSVLHQQQQQQNDYFQSESFDFDFPSTTFDIESTWNIESRPESRTSMASVSTPRPPSATATMCSSPLTPYQHGGQPSPVSNNNNNTNINNTINNINNNNNSNMINNNLSNGNNNNNNNLNLNNNTSTSSSSSNSNFGGSNLQTNTNATSVPYPFDDKDKVQEQLKMHENTSERLRNLLTKSPHIPTVVDQPVEQQDRANHFILKVKFFLISFVLIFSIVFFLSN